MTHRLARRALLGAGALLALPAYAQSFPQRPIRFICPFPAGGIVDILMRAFTEELGAELGQPVVIDPRPGAGGLIGSQQLVAAPADGHTWMMATQAHLVAPILTPSNFHPVEAVQGFAVLRSATLGGAEVIRRAELGRVAEGCLADLLVVEGDPLADLGVLQDQGAKLAMILKGGVAVKDLL